MTEKTLRDRIGKRHGVVVITISANMGTADSARGYTVHAFYLTRSGTTGSPLSVHYFAADDRGFHLHVANGFRFQFKDVVAHYHHVCEFAG
jgi:phenylacetate-coenzyme A ligase PaaK-like adenylate-forming protein